MHHVVCTHSIQISRTNMPTLSSVIVSLEKKKNGKNNKKTPHTDERCFKSCQVLLSPLYSHSFQLLSYLSFLLSECPALFILLSVLHLTVSVFRHPFLRWKTQQMDGIRGLFWSIRPKRGHFCIEEMKPAARKESRTHPKFRKTWIKDHVCSQILKNRTFLSFRATQCLLSLAPTPLLTRPL